MFVYFYWVARFFLLLGPRAHLVLIGSFNTQAKTCHEEWRTNKQSGGQPGGKGGDPELFEHFYISQIYNAIGRLASGNKFSFCETSSLNWDHMPATAQRTKQCHKNFKLHCLHAQVLPCGLFQKPDPFFGRLSRAHAPCP